jgi:hypothetical protein
MSNKKLRDSFRWPNIVTVVTVKCRRLRWAGGSLQRGDRGTKQISVSGNPLQNAHVEDRKVTGGRCEKIG